MRKALLTALTAIVLLGSCTPANKCKNTKYVYKEGEHPEKILPPKIPVKPTPKDFTFNSYESTNKLTPYANYQLRAQKQNHEVAINMYPSRANKWIEIIPIKEEKVLVAKYDIDLNKEKEHLEYQHPGIRDGPFVIYHGSEDSESVFAEVSKGFPLSRLKKDSIKGERFYPFPENFSGNSYDAKKLYFQGLEYALYLDEREMQISGQ